MTIVNMTCAETGPGGVINVLKKEGGVRCARAGIAGAWARAVGWGVRVRCFVLVWLGGLGFWWVLEIDWGKGRGEVSGGFGFGWLGLLRQRGVVV